MFKKSIICLANSRKLNARCIAGKDILDNKWIRPVSSFPTGELSLEEIKYADGSIPKLLDIIEISFESPLPKIGQPENILIKNMPWLKKGTFNKDEIDNLVDSPDILWTNTPHNDRVTSQIESMAEIKNSLYFIKVEELKIKKTSSIRGRSQIRVIFNYNKFEYDLVITDLLVEREFENKQEGSYTLHSNNIYLCISLGEEFQGYHYKLVASILRV
jgi:hypothetical protein